MIYFLKLEQFSRRRVCFYNYQKDGAGFRVILSLGVLLIYGELFMLEEGSPDSR